MKKVISILLVLVMALGLCACNSKDNEAAASVSSLIEAIGTVCFSSAQVINDAQAAYDRLTPKQQELVTNFSTLFEAVNTWNEKYYVEGIDYSCTRWLICDNDVKDITKTNSLYVMIENNSHKTTLKVDDAHDKLILSNYYGTFFAKMSNETIVNNHYQYDLTWEETPIVVENKKTTYSGISFNYATGEVNIYYVLDWEDGKSILDGSIGENAYNVFEEFMISAG